MTHKRASAVVVMHNPQRSKIICGFSLKWDCWEIAGGKLEVGETALQGSCREVLEETGIKLNPVLCDYKGFVENHDFVCQVFSCSTIDDPLVLEPDKHREWGWFSILEIPVPMRLITKEAIKLWLDT